MGQKSFINGRLLPRWMRRTNLKDSLIGKPYAIVKHRHGMRGWMAGLICGLCFLAMLVILRLIVG